MADALLLQHTSVCAEWGPVHYASINHQCVPSDDWYATCASVIVGVTPDTLLLHVNSVCRVMTGKLLHQISLCAELWVTECYCIRYRCVRSDDWYIITASIITVCDVRCSSTAFFYVFGAMTDARLLYQSLLVRSDNRYFIAASVSNVCGRRNDALLLHQTAVCGVRTGALLQYQLSVCTVCWLTYCYCICQQCARRYDWCTITESVITVRGIDWYIKNVCHHCLGWWLTHYPYISLHCLRSNDWCNIT